MKSITPLLFCRKGKNYDIFPFLSGDLQLFLPVFTFLSTRKHLPGKGEFMAIVTALQFSPSSGAMICDEEYWYLRRRRSYFLDNLKQIVPEDIAEKLGIEAAYGGYGHPGFHEEVLDRSRKAIRSAFDSGPGTTDKNPTLSDLESIAMIVRRAIQETRRRRIDDMLKFLYGFTVDDLNRQQFSEDGKTYDIKQDAVLSEARKLVNYEKKNAMTEAIFKNKAVIIGFDPEHRFRSFHLNAENTVCSLVSGGFEAIGAGLYGAGVAFSQIMNHLTLDERRQGIGRVWGMIALFEATMKAYDHFHEVGGGLNIVYINGEGKKHKDRYFEFSDSPTRLAREMVYAKQHDFIDYETLYPLMEDVLFNGKPVADVEKTFLDSVTDLEATRRLLRGYKFSPYPQKSDPGKTTKTGSSSRKSGGKK